MEREDRGVRRRVRVRLRMPMPMPMPMPMLILILILNVILIPRLGVVVSYQELLF